MTPFARFAASLGARGLRAEVLAGLGTRPRTLPTKLLYDAEGSVLFERITELPEYYLTRTELGILRGCLDELAELVGPEALVLEPGSGSGRKARMVLRELRAPRAYVPVDVAEEQLRGLVRTTRAEVDGLDVIPLVADYTRTFELPASSEPARRTFVFFPGSTIGNFAPEAARRFLAMLGRVAGSDGAMLLGADLRKSPLVIEPAYNDAAGVTAAFNRNVLRHLNRVLDTDFDPDAFGHHAPWVARESRVEMRLISLRDQTVTVPESEVDGPLGNSGTMDGPVRIRFPEGEYIVTEHSHKATPEALDRLIASAGWRTTREWRDPADWYSVRFLERCP